MTTLETVGFKQKQIYASVILSSPIFRLIKYLLKMVTCEHTINSYPNWFSECIYDNDWRKTINWDLFSTGFVELLPFGITCFMLFDYLLRAKILQPITRAAVYYWKSGIKAPHTQCFSCLDSCGRQIRKRWRHRPPTTKGTLEVRQICFVWFDLFDFCSFKYSPLLNCITNSTLKSILCKI